MDKIMTNSSQNTYRSLKNYVLIKVDLFVRKIGMGICFDMTESMLTRSNGGM